MEHISTSTNIYFERRDGERIPAKTSMEVCRRAGYEEMDFCFVDQIFTPSPFTEDGWERYIKEYAALAEKLGIRFTQTHGHIHDFCNNRDPQQWELVLRCLRATAMLGSPWMVMHPSTLVTDGKMDPATEEINAEYFGRLADEAAKWGVGIAIENMWGETKEGVKCYAIQPEELLSLTGKLGRKNIGVCWDTEHGSIEALDQGRAIRMLKGLIHATHISDETGRNNIHILPYTGHMDWDEVLRAFADIEYRDAFTYEIQHYLLAMPHALVPEAVRLSFLVGEEMIRTIRSFRLSEKEEK